MVVATSAAVFLLFHIVAAREEDGERLMVALLEVASQWSRHSAIMVWLKLTQKLDSAT